MRKIEIQIKNDLPIKIVSDMSGDNEDNAIICLKEMKLKAGQIKIGQIIKFHDKEYIILGHKDGITFAIDKDFIKNTDREILYKIAELFNGFLIMSSDSEINGLKVLEVKDIYY